MTRHLAILMMIFAWLIYGAMPALAECPICDSGMPMPGIASSTGMTGMGDMSGMAMGAPASHTGEKSNPCSGDMAHVSFCAACLILPPALAIDTAKISAFSYPEPALSDPFTGDRPQPMAPPPRFI
jgi:hypothetical protein